MKISWYIAYALGVLAKFTMCFTTITASAIVANSDYSAFVILPLGAMLYVLCLPMTGPKGLATNIHKRLSV